MAFDGAGTFLRLYSWVVDATNSVKIRADRHDEEDNNFAAGLSNCITKDGQTSVTQNIPMNSRRIISLADPIDPQDAATKDYADTKVAKIGAGTITGDLTVSGNTTIGGTLTVGSTISATGYQTRQGLPGPYTGHYFNFDWNGSVVNAWMDNSNIGALATAAYVNTQDAAIQSSLQAQINTKQANLGFTPVQQGGGSGMATNKVYIGWSGGQLLCQVDSVPQGAFSLSKTPNALRLLFAADAYVHTNPISEPYPGAVITGFGMLAGSAYARFRYLQIYTDSTGWITVGYA